MATIIADRAYAPDDLLKLPDGNLYELVDGQLLSKEMGAIECNVATLLIGAMAWFLQTNRIGKLFTELQYRCFSFDPTLVRRPDISFISVDRATDEVMAAGIVRIAPDLVVEIVSPNDAYHDVDTKIDEYLRAGVRLVWVLNPRQGTALVYRQDGSTSRLTAVNELDGEEVLPGLKIAMASLLTTLEAK